MYFKRSSKDEKPQKKAPKNRVINGHTHYIQNGVKPKGRPPSSQMNGTVRQDHHMMHPPILPMSRGYPMPAMMGGAMPIPGTYRGPPPVFAPTFSRNARAPHRMQPMHPYFFQPTYGPQIIYVDTSGSESESDEQSIRSTVREKKKRYHRSFLEKNSSIVIK